jgi:serine/threonine protein kinase
MDRYVFEEELVGSGGFGKVRRAHDALLDRDVAVKTLDPLIAEFSEAEQERFKREARVLAKLSHTNIPSVYEVDFSGGGFSIYFQFIEGQNLRKIMEQNGPSPIGTARTWFLQVASALEHAHKNGVIHRDIKPENIIITPDLESAYLVDFGIALTAEEAKKLTRSGYVIGTPGYMSPEQIAGEMLDPRTDVYSLAVTFYEALAGRRMPVGNYEPLSANEAIPSSIDDLIFDCLNPRERRLASARLFSARLTGALMQPTKPLSDVLAHGKLHELGSAIEEMSPSEFTALPRGQRILILSKIVDVVGSNEHSLMYAGERFLQLMLTRGLLMDRDDYREIVKPGIVWAFEKQFEGGVGRVGRESIRKSLEEAAFLARDSAYDVLSEEMLAYLKDVELESKEDWYLHTVRDVIEALMANPQCDRVAAELGVTLRKINRVQRGKPWRASAAPVY